MTQDGFWWVNIGDDIELPQCDISFDDKGTLDVTVTPGTSVELLNKVKVLPEEFSQAFKVRIEKANKMEATFHVCRLDSTSKQSPMVASIDWDTGDVNEPKIGRTFHFKYTLA